MLIETNIRYDSKDKMSSTEVNMNCSRAVFLLFTVNTTTTAAPIVTTAAPASAGKFDIQKN